MAFEYWRLRAVVVLVVLPLLIAGTACAHDHHEEDIPEGQAISAEPVDSILWIHIVLQMMAYGVVFPVGMVLGIVRNRWHVPTQVFGSVLAVVGYFLGHAHKGRQFASNIHASFANTLQLMLVIQLGLGIYLRLHLEKGFQGKIRRYFVAAHGVLGKIMPVVSWVQMLFGGITALGFCRDDHLGQCLAHFIMGSAFIGYGIVLTIIMLVGQAWIRRTGRSQEFFDSALIAAWGCVNTFTEHRWGQPWRGNDIQHTTMGIIWWCAGLAGVWLSRKRDGRPKRNFIPGFVILITGWAMSAHPQHLELSAMVHTMFGYTLMAAGLTRIIEIAFVLRDAHTVSEDGDANSFQYIPPFLLYASGFLFLGATEEQMQLISDAKITHVSYILVLYSFAFMLFLFVNMLLHLFALHTPTLATTKSGPPVPPEDVDVEAEVQRQPRLPRMGGHRPTDSRQIRDAEEFELAGLMSDGEDEAEGDNGHGRTESPSTLGKNSEIRV